MRLRRCSRRGERHERSQGAIEAAEYLPHDGDEPFMNDKPERVVSQQACLALEAGSIIDESRDTVEIDEGRHHQHSGPRGPRLCGDRPRAGAAGSRPSAQADRQDRCRPPPDRGRHLRLLRNDGGADLAETPRRPVRSPPCRSKLRRCTSVAKRCTATADDVVAAQNALKVSVVSVRSIPSILCKLAFTNRPISTPGST